MKKTLTYLFSLLLISSLVFLYSFSSSKNLNKKIIKIEVEFEEGTNDFLTHKMVNKLLIQKNKSVQNQAKSVIDLQGLEYVVLSNPYIEKATVYYTIDGVLRTIIKQRTPIARVNAFNTSYYIDKQGVRVPLSTNYSARVILVTGAILEGDLKQITKYVNVILADDFLKKEIIGIHKKKNKEYLLNVRSGSYKIEFGKLDDVKTKFSKLKAFYNSVSEEKTLEKYKTINLKYHNQVVCAK